MPDQNNTQTSNPTNNTTEPVVAASDSVVVDPSSKAPANQEQKSVSPTTTRVVDEIISKIGDSHNVLIALSSDPSVDEMATAIGLSIYLDKLGKRATAIYSGTTPNALEFLKPEDTFETSVDTLQDFIIAINKEKADHLRYKLDGDFVKIYITPYRTRIAKDDLDFSYGDFNVDLVLALNVANGADLDSALREHGRIMHDASIVNITTGKPGKLGEIEWSEKSASSVSEMIANLLYNMAGEQPIEQQEATAFLTGIVAATDRFSNNKTTPETMQLSSKLMESGANQQLVSKNITPEVENKLLTDKPKDKEPQKSKETEAVSDQDKASSSDDQVDKSQIDENQADNVQEGDKEDPTMLNVRHEDKSQELLDDLKSAAVSLSNAGAEAVPEPVEQPVDINDDKAMNISVDSPANPELEENQRAEKTIQPPQDIATNSSVDEGSDKYSHMMDDALSNIEAPNMETALPQVEQPVATPEVATTNPAAANTPETPVNPEINGVPSINYMPMPGEEILPPPPAPPVDFGANPEPTPAAAPTPEAVAPTEPVLPNVAPITPIEPAAPAPEPTPEPLGNQPAMQDQIYAPQAADPGAFKIPGM